MRRFCFSESGGFNGGGRVHIPLYGKQPHLYAPYATKYFSLRLFLLAFPLYLKVGSNYCNIAAGIRIYFAPCLSQIYSLLLDYLLIPDRDRGLRDHVLF
ncbi:hypothetical protein C8R43DRAFT_1008428 [Mycena crocata]|nr:hypothetical protein C8R43DRAFT_1008428 [Mycena crocata]